MPTTTTTQPTELNLERAADLLQRAHDWIELHGFNIEQYGTRTRAEAAQYPAYPPQMCYIGTVRFLADPHLLPSPRSGDPSEGDGPELALALAKLDEVARPHIQRLPRRLRKKAEDRFRLYIPEEGADEDVHTGRFIEHLGFLISVRAEERYPDDSALSLTEREKLHQQRQEYQRGYALKILRKALTEIHSGVA